MRTDEVHVLVDRAAALESCPRDRVSAEGVVSELARLRAWLDGRDVAAARLIGEVSSFPEKSLADAARSNLREAARLLERAKTVEQIPALGSSLNGGRVSGAHVDVITKALHQLQPATRARLIDGGPPLVALAETVSADEFARTVGAETRRLERDSDGLDRLERQKRAIRLSTWIDKHTGMGRWSATWDPETMVRLETLLDQQVQTMFHEQTPPGCPTDLLEKQSYLRALALLALNEQGGAGRPGKPEIIVVVDHTQARSDGKPSIDWGLPVDLPDQVFADLQHRAKIYTVTVNGGVIVDAPGDVNLGRATRVANRAQRRALRGLYTSCAIPGCAVRYSRTKLHHVTWWRNGGATDLDNLLPLCEIHHQHVHHDNWVLRLAPNRQLTITLPDGHIMTTGPPRRAAA